LGGSAIFLLQNFLHLV